MTEQQPHVPDDRINGLIALLNEHHAGGFVNYTIDRDEFLSLLLEVRAARRSERAAS